ncbi:syntaxin [Frankliniella occidentalis]|uniref:Syntaxin n=1 Tax=Frankliniella occidentalis TaxID=133901 RepID=A0A6J1TCM3_FRAOC|nr:syntaxin [Frankliniella occidentalis]
MPRDRLKALQAVSSSYEEQRLNTLPPGLQSHAVNMGTLGPRAEPGVNPAFSVDEESDAMDAFFKQVEEARELTRGVKDHVKEMRRLHSQVLSSPRPDQSIKEELERRSADVKSAVKKVTHILKALERGLEADSTAGGSSAAQRIRRTQHSTCLHLLVEALTEFNAEQEDYKNKCEERIKRVICIAKVEVSDEKLENLMETGNFGSIFNGDIITETLEARQALEDVTARHQEIIKLERSIRDLRDMFVEMSLLVERQGDMINNIERQVQQTRDHVETANVVAKKAIKYQSKFKKKRIILYAILAVILVILVTVIILQFVPTTGSNNNNSNNNNNNNRSLQSAATTTAATTTSTATITTTTAVPPTTALLPNQLETETPSL